MKTVTAYFTHDEMCEILDVPKESVLAFKHMHYNLDDMWVLKMHAGTLEEIEKVMENSDL